MGARTDEIERHIATTRTELGHNLHELETRVKQEADWRVHFRRHVAALLGIAFGIGLMFSLAVPSRRRKRR